MTVDGHETADSTLVDTQITLINTAVVDGNSSSAPKTVDDVWREIVSGKRRKMKEEAPDELMTLEDFLAKAEALVEEDDRVKVEPAERISGGGFRFESMPRASSLPVVDTVEVMGGGGGGRRKRGRAVLEQLDKAAQQRQRRMIKNRESAARSRERKQAYQVELESLAVRLEEENEQLLKEKEERTKERFKQLMEKVIPVVEKRKPARVLQRVCSSEW